MLAAAKREARRMGQNSTRLLMSATTAPIANHLGQVVGPEPVDNYGCEICGWWSRTSPFPFPHCTYCGEQPAYHHGRCCPQNPYNLAGPFDDADWRVDDVESFVNGNNGTTSTTEEEHITSRTLSTDDSQTDGEFQPTVFMALKSKEPVPPTVPTAEPTPEICCVVCDKVCNFDNEEAKWSGDEDPVPTCSKGCRMYYYSQKGITDYFELEGISEDDSLRMIEQHLRNRRGNASASSDDFELVEDYTGRMHKEHMILRF